MLCTQGGWVNRYFVQLVGVLPVIRLNFFHGLGRLINIDAHICKEFPKKSYLSNYGTF
jgi:hypothetical protein